MSRAGATLKRQVEAGLTAKIPLKPEAVVAYEQLQRERNWMMIFARCRFIARGPHLPVPELHGVMVADNVLNAIMQQMIAAQSQIVVPR